MPRKQKGIGAIIVFDDKEYSHEEASFLSTRFFSVLARIAEKKSPQSIYRKCFRPIFVNN